MSGDPIELSLQRGQIAVVTEVKIRQVRDQHTQNLLLRVVVRRYRGVFLQVALFHIAFSGVVPFTTGRIPIAGPIAGGATARQRLLVADLFRQGTVRNAAGIAGGAVSVIKPLRIFVAIRVTDGVRF